MSLTYSLTGFNIVKSCTPHWVVITGDLNCRSKQWWPGDVEHPEGLESDEVIASNNLTQLIDESTYLLDDKVWYISFCLI